MDNTDQSRRAAREKRANDADEGYRERGAAPAPLADAAHRVITLARTFVKANDEGDPVGMHLGRLSDAIKDYDKAAPAMESDA